jgi:hypothetical protein
MVTIYNNRLIGYTRYMHNMVEVGTAEGLSAHSPSQYLGIISQKVIAFQIAQEDKGTLTVH